MPKGRSTLEPPVHNTVKALTIDTAECKIHRVVAGDGTVRFTASYPVEWNERPDTIMVDGITGGQHEATVYEIMKWEEVELEIKT